MTKILIDRATVEQALEALFNSKEFAAIYATPRAATVEAQCHQSITALRAELAQPQEPVALPSEDEAGRAFWGCYPMGDGDKSEVWMTAFRWCRAMLSRQAARDQSVAQPVQEPVPFDLNTMPGQADAHLRALLRYTENFYATAIQHGMRAGPTANAIAHVERAGKALHEIVHAQAKMLEPAQPVQDTDCHAQGICQRSGYSIGQRKPLSGIEVERLLEQVIGSLPVARKLIRAVEAAHGIGGQP